MSGSPMIDIQASSNDHTPNLLNRLDAFSSCRWENGNHLRSYQCKRYRPIPQLTTAPIMFPHASTVTSIIVSNWPDLSMAANMTSDENGKMVVAKKAPRNRLITLNMGGVITALTGKCPFNIGSKFIERTRGDTAWRCKRSRCRNTKASRNLANWIALSYGALALSEG